jgi:hypothetical protein
MQRRRDDGKGKLEHGVDRFGNRHAQMRDTELHRVMHVDDAAKERMTEAAEIRGTAGRERDRIADDPPKHGHQTGDHEALRERREDVLLAHHAAVEQCQAWNRHHEHERCGGQHPGGIAGVDVREFHDRRFSRSRRGSGRRSRCRRRSIGWRYGRRILRIDAARARDGQQREDECGQHCDNSSRLRARVLFCSLNGRHSCDSLETCRRNSENSDSF